MEPVANSVYVDTPFPSRASTPKSLRRADECEIMDSLTFARFGNTAPSIPHAIELVGKADSSCTVVDDLSHPGASHQSPRHSCNAVLRNSTTSTPNRSSVTESRNLSTAPAPATAIANGSRKLVRRVQAEPAIPPSIDENDSEQVQGRQFVGEWKLGKTIGEGSSGKVKIARHRITKLVVFKHLMKVCCQSSQKTKVTYW